MSAEVSTTTTTTTPEGAEVIRMARAAKDVAQALANASTEDKNRILNDAAAALEARASDIMAANERDIRAGREAGLSEALIDRLALTPERVKGIADGLRQVASLPDPVGDIVAGRTLANGLRIRQVRVPLGVMGMVYEARPNVTVDAFGLALKSGNVALLRGSQSAWHSNSQLVEILQETLAEHGFPREVVQLLPCETRESVQDLITARGLVDVVGLIGPLRREGAAGPYDGARDQCPGPHHAHWRSTARRGSDLPGGQGHAHRTGRAQWSRKNNDDQAPGRRLGGPGLRSGSCGRG